jgi:hypothetical protein
MPIHIFIEVNKKLEVKYGLIFISEKVDKFFINDEDFWSHISSLKCTKSQIFIHGLWANTPKYHHSMIQKLDKEVWSGLDLIIHYIWEGHWIYPLNHNYIKNGLVPIFNKKTSKIFHILQVYNISILAHSMGTIMANYLIEKIEDKILIKVFYAAADCDYADFARIKERKNMEVFLLNNPKDRTLLLTSLVKPYQRLGLMTEVDSCKILSKIDTSKDDIIPARFMKHRFFYTNHSVRTWLKSCIDN